MDTSSTWMPPIAACIVGLLSKIVWDWLIQNRDSKALDGESTEACNRLEVKIDAVDRKVDSLIADHSVSDPKTGRKMIYMPPGALESIAVLKDSSHEHISLSKQYNIEQIAISKQINDGISQIAITLRDFFRSNADTLKKNNEILSSVSAKLDK
jgi:hypothetical protein